MPPSNITCFSFFIRQSSRANCLGVLGFTRLIIHQSSSGRTFDCINHPLGIGNSKRDAAVVAKVKFGQIVVQMGLPTMLVNALHAALENTPNILNRVCVSLASHIFIAGGYTPLTIYSYYVTCVPVMF